ncbi:hypothetical protein VPH35_101796 [Triticum aestivum]
MSSAYSKDWKKRISVASNYKKLMLSEIKFDGLLKLPKLLDVDLEYNKYLVYITDIKEKCFNVSEDRNINFYANDFEKVFGIPCGVKQIYANNEQTHVDFLKDNIGMIGDYRDSLQK